MIPGQNPSFHLHAGDIRYADPDGQGSDHDTYDVSYEIPADQGYTGGKQTH